MKEHAHIGPGRNSYAHTYGCSALSSKSCQRRILIQWLVLHEPAFLALATAPCTHTCTRVRVNVNVNNKCVKGKALELLCVPAGLGGCNLCYTSLYAHITYDSPQTHISCCPLCVTLRAPGVSMQSEPNLQPQLMC